MTAPVRLGLGTEKSPEAPWQSYDRQMDRMQGASPALRAALAAYSQKRHQKETQAGLEEQHRQHELSCDAVKSYRWDKQDELVTEKDREGKILNCLEFMRRLNKIVRCGFGNPEACKGLIGITCFKPTMDGGRWTYAGPIQVGYMHEYSTIWLDAHKLPLNEKWRGWRTVLLRLIQGGFITEQQAHKEFGEPITGPVSRRYRDQLYHLRNREQKSFDTDGNRA